jgi:predicted metalloprotease
LLVELIPPSGSVVTDDTLAQRWTTSIRAESFRIGGSCRRKKRLRLGDGLPV